MKRPGTHFFRDTPGYFLNLNLVICARPYPDESGAYVVVQMTASKFASWFSSNEKQPQPQISMWSSERFMVLRLEWERVLAVSRGEP